MQKQKIKNKKITILLVYLPKQFPRTVSWQGFYSIMNLKIISWNVRGLNDAGKGLALATY
jgi:hypothetical protein